jgi:hypothetical protein
MENSWFEFIDEPTEEESNEPEMVSIPLDLVTDDLEGEFELDIPYRNGIHITEPMIKKAIRLAREGGGYERK